MSGWRATKLSEVATIRHGWPFKSELMTDKSGDNPVVVSIGNFRYSGGFRFHETKVREYSGEFPKEYLLVPGDILLIMTCQTEGGEILGIPAMIPNDGRQYLHNQRLGKVVVTDQSAVTSDFLYWFFLTSEFNQQLVGSASGTKIVHTAPSRIEACDILLPPVQEQRVITTLLSGIDWKIDLLDRQNKTLEAMAETLFRQWFVEEASGDCEEIPFERFFDFLEGPGIRNWQYTESGTPFINIRLISNGDIDISKANFVSNEEANGKYSHFQLNAGDMIVSTSGTLGKNAIVRSYHLPLILNTSVIRFRPRDGRSYSFVYQYLNSRLFQEHLESAASGSVQANFGPTHLKQMTLSKPPQEILNRYLVQADPLYEKLELNQAQIKSLETLRDTLLPKLMSGEVRVAA